MQIRGNFPDLFRSTALPFLREFTVQRYKEFKPKWMEIFRNESTTRDLEQYSEASGLGQMLPINEGGDVQDDLAVKGFNRTIDPVMFGRSIRISVHMMENDKWGLMKRWTQSLATNARIHQEIRAAAILNRAFSGSYVGGDGVPLSSLSHPLVKSGGLNANTLTGAAALTVSSLQDALIAAEMQRDHQGNLIHVPWTSLLVSPSNRFNAAEIIKSEQRSDTANNTTNALRFAEDGLPTPKVWKYMATAMGGTDANWFLMAPPEETGLIWLWRKKSYTKQWTEDRSETGVFALRYWATPDFVHPWGVFGVQG